MGWNADGSHGEKGKSGSMKSVGGKVDSPTTSGDKGIVPGIKSQGGAETSKGVQSPTTGGDKGIVPMKSNPSAKAPLD